jgi:Fe2+ transport system protein FeoA
MFRVPGSVFGVSTGNWGPGTKGQLETAGTLGEGDGTGSYESALRRSRACDIILISKRLGLGARPQDGCGSRLRLRKGGAGAENRLTAMGCKPLRPNS